VKFFSISPRFANGRAFTLIELLIVAAIITILAAIAVPNFLQAQTRAKVARVHAEMRTMMEALELYHVDNNAYPYRRNTLGTLRRTPHVPQLDTRLAQLSKLTSPVAYISTLPPDVFEATIPPPNNLLDYYDPAQFSWLVNSRHGIDTDDYQDPETIGYLLVSVGPDGYLGTGPNNYGWPALPSLRLTIFRPYDPTNGTISDGNIYINRANNAEKTASQFLQWVTPRY